MAKSTKGRIANRAGVSDIFGVSMPTVDLWVREGMPAVSRGGRGVEWQFNTADVSKWLRERESARGDKGETTDIEELKRRKVAAETGLAELELAKQRGEVASIDDFERVQTRLMTTIRANILNVPARAALQLLGETSETIFKEKLRAELVLALEQAASSDIEPDEEEDEEV